ncbi:hypothetical protein [Rhizobium sp. GCM10022189]|uniref:hypothetical protein n=1 Tax=Rhizobium sp. GCM10022189 TaxID=3252654 RepID=UPI0036162887
MNVLANDEKDKKGNGQALASLRDDVARAARLLTLRQMAAATVLDLRQPLSVIALDCGAAMHMLENREAPVNQLGTLLQRIVDSVSRAEDVIATFDQTVMKRYPSCQELDLGEVIATAVHFVSCESTSRGLRIQCSIDGDSNKVQGDRVALQQVFVGALVAVMRSIAPSSGQKLLVTKDTDEYGIKVTVTAKQEHRAEANIPVTYFGADEEDERIASLEACKAIVEVHLGKLVPIENEFEFGYEIWLPTLPFA